MRNIRPIKKRKSERTLNPLNLRVSICLLRLTGLCVWVCSDFGLKANGPYQGRFPEGQLSSKVKSPLVVGRHSMQNKTETNQTAYSVIQFDNVKIHLGSIAAN